MRDEVPRAVEDVVRSVRPLDTDMRAFFAFFGLIWTIPAAILIRWMERVDRR